MDAARQRQHRAGKEQHGAEGVNGYEDQRTGHAKTSDPLPAGLRLRSRSRKRDRHADGDHLR
jgi:hypothetical protein